MMILPVILIVIAAMYMVTAIIEAKKNVKIIDIMILLGIICYGFVMFSLSVLWATICAIFILIISASIAISQGANNASSEYKKN